MSSKTAAGMLREWTFRATLEHKAARCRLRVLPQWVTMNVDADEVAMQADPLRPYTAVKPFLAFQDLTAPSKAGEASQEVAKQVTFYRCKMSALTTLQQWCKRCIQFVISDEKTLSVDGDKRLHHLVVGKKLSQCQFQLSGNKCFAFTFKQHDKTATIQESHHVAFGTIVKGAAYMVIARCTTEPELHAYVSELLVPNLSDSERFTLDVDVTYPEATNQTLQLQQELFGVFKYFDKSAAIEFSIPMHPLQIRPDHSPLQSAGFGSLTCLTLELDVYHKLYDTDEGGNVASMPGMPKFKANSVVLYIEVEDVIKLGFPPVMSVDQYSALKTKKLLDTFRDARIVGAPLSLQLGQRVGRSTTCTFSYELEGPSSALGVSGRQQARGKMESVKALIVSTLVGSHGATAVFFTKSGQALFDTHVYIFHHLMKTLRFYTERELVGSFNKEDASRVRLTDQDLPRAYAAGGEKSRPLLQKHLAAIQASTDGEVDDATVVVISADEEAADGMPAKPPRSTVSFTTFAGSALRAADEMAQDSDSVVSVRDIAHLADLQQAEDDEPQVASPSNDGAAPHDAPVARQDTVVAEGSADNKPTDVTDGEAPAQSATDGGDGRGRSPEQPFPVPSAAAPDKTAAADDAPLDDDPSVAALIHDALSTNRDADILAARGQPLRGVYRACCEAEGAKPNSYLVQKLPDQARFTKTIEELDMSFNYVGHAGFRAILRLLRSMPKLHTVHFNSMSLDNSDVEHMCAVLATNTTVRVIHLRQNARVTLPSATHLLRLLRTNPRIVSISLSGCDIGPALLKNIEEKALDNSRRSLLLQATEAPSNDQGDAPAPTLVLTAAHTGGSESEDPRAEPIAVG